MNESGITVRNTAKKKKGKTKGKRVCARHLLDILTNRERNQTI